MRTDSARPCGLSSREEYELWTLLGQVNDGMLRVRDRELKLFGISTVQVGILYALAHGEHPMTQSDVANWVFRKPHTVAAALRRMEERGLVVQSRALDGRRQMSVEMTEKGLALFRQQHRRREAVPRVLASLTPEERRLLQVLLRRLRASTMLELAAKPPYP